MIRTRLGVETGVVETTKNEFGIYASLPDLSQGHEAFGKDYRFSVVNRATRGRLADFAFCADPDMADDSPRMTDRCGCADGPLSMLQSVLVEVAFGDG